MSKIIKSQNKKKSIQINPQKYYVHLIEPPQKIDGFQFIDLVTFQKKTKNDTSSDIFIGDLLEYFPVAETTDLLRSLISKTGKNHKIYIQGVDAKAISYNFATDQIDSIMFNALIYNNGNKKNIFTFPNLKYILDNIGEIDITNIKFINSLNYYVECQKK